MSKILSADNLLRLILNEQSAFYPQPIIGDTKPLKDNYLNQFSRNENSVKIVFDHIQFKILQISDNVETYTGYTAKEFYDSNMLFVLGLLTLDHFNFIYVWLNWAFSVHTKLGDLHNSKQAVCGVKLKHKNGRVIRLMLRYSALEMMDSGIVKIAAISIDDITHLIKGDFYWGRLEIGENEQNIHHFFSIDKKDNSQDIISDREKNVLRFIAEGRESKEIAEILSISSNTVDNHRRNMIAKTGARDTTALVQLCRMSGII
jgi:DNA-binding CsgD family transcriptional regulator